MNDKEMVVAGLGVVIVILFAVLAWKFPRKCTPSAETVAKCAKTVCATCTKVPVINNFPSQSGSFYIQSKASNLYLKSDGTMGPSATATLFTWNKSTNELSPKINGYSFQLNFTDAGVVLNLSGYAGTIFALATTNGKPATLPILDDKITSIGLATDQIQNVGNINMQNFYGNLVVFV